MFEIAAAAQIGGHFFGSSPKRSKKETPDSQPNVYEDFLRMHQQAAQKRASPHMAQMVRNPYNPQYRENVTEIPRSHSQSTVSSGYSGSGGSSSVVEQRPPYAQYAQQPYYGGGGVYGVFEQAPLTNYSHMELPRSSSEVGSFGWREAACAERMRADTVLCLRDKEIELRELQVRLEREKHELVLQSRESSLQKDHQFEVYKLTQMLKACQRSTAHALISPKPPSTIEMQALEPSTPVIGLSSSTASPPSVLLTPVVAEVTAATASTLPSNAPPQLGRARSIQGPTAQSSNNGHQNRSSGNGVSTTATFPSNARRRSRRTTTPGATLASSRDPDQDGCVTMFTVITFAHLLVILGALTLIIIIASSTSSVLVPEPSSDSGGSEEIYIVDHSKKANRKLLYVYILTTAASITVLGIVWMAYNIAGWLMQGQTKDFRTSTVQEERVKLLSRYNSTRSVMKVLRVIGIQISFLEILNILVYFVLCGTAKTSLTTGGMAGVFVFGAGTLVWLVQTMMQEVVLPFLDEVDVLKDVTASRTAVSIPPALKMTPSEQQLLSIEEKAQGSIAVALFEFPHHSLGEDLRLRRMRLKKVRQAPLSRPQIAAHTRLHWAVPAKNAAESTTCVICMCPIECGNIEEITRQGESGARDTLPIVHHKLPAAKSISVLVENDDEEKHVDQPAVMQEDVVQDIPSISTSADDVKIDMHEQHIPASASLPNNQSNAENKQVQHSQTQPEYILSSIVMPGDVDQQIENIELVRTQPCLHSFHKACAEQWLGTRPTCPLCRQHVVLSSRQSYLLTQNTHKDVDDTDDYLHSLARYENRGYMEPQGDWVQIRYEEEWEPFVTTVNNVAARTQFSPRQRTPTVIRLNRDRMRALSQLQRRQYLENQQIDQGIRTSRQRSTGELLAAIGPPRQIRRADSETEATLRVDQAVTMTRERRTHGRRTER